MEGQVKELERVRDRQMCEYTDRQKNRYSRQRETYKETEKD